MSIAESVIAVLPSAATLVSYTLAVLVLVFTPGPDMAYFLGRTLTQGRAAGLMAVMGTTVGLYVHTGLAAAGLSTLLAASPAAFAALKWIGAAYLVWLAVATLRHGSAFTPQAARARLSLGRVFLAGLGINLFNPKIVLFFVTFLPQFVDPADIHAHGQIALLGGLYGVIGAPCCAMLVLAADRVAGAFTRSRALRRALDVALASLFGAFALRLMIGRS